MAPQYSSLSGSAALAYAEAYEQALSQRRNEQRGNFDFLKKNLSGRDYWYLRFRLSGTERSFYLGQDSPDLRAAIERQKALWKEGQSSSIQREKAVAMALAAGCTPTPHRAYKVLKAVEIAGYFHAGGVLIGSFAYIAIGNILSCAWPAYTTVTQDVDLAVSDKAMLVLPKRQPIKDVLLDAEQGLLEVPMFDPKSPATSFKIRGSVFRVDLITPQEGKPEGGARYVRAVDGYAQPLIFIDYLLEDTVKALLLHKDGVLVNVPSPARYALHKVVIARRRNTGQAVKARKDMQQVVPLLACLLQERPGDVWLAIDAARDYPGSAFLRDLRAGLGKLAKEEPGLSPVHEYCL